MSGHVDEIIVGGSYFVFHPKGHPWYRKEVTVMKIEGRKCHCVLFRDLFAALKTPSNSTKRTIETKVIKMDRLDSEL